MTVITSMFIFALIGAISPGPVNIIATGSGASFGFKKTLPHIMGASIAYRLIVLFVGLGLNKWISLYPQFMHILQYVGAAFLLYMAYKIATAEPNQVNEIQTNKQSPLFIEGALAQFLNPKAWLVSMSGISLFVSSQIQSFLYLSIFCMISLLVCIIGISTWAAMGHSISGLLSTKKRQIGFNVFMGLLLSGTVVSILLS
ncbi:LysE family translocator [Pseudoalteromonas sp. C2R02]|uniref:LysE family translocator n=1 Tax=Pseudoalteromonas sp. C2R02 TaxID=2841565 RepID=UPI0020915DEF|nr:LysE family translocator [Pseudoalteromonas sp. C2R02]